jgi:haloalkane dehalogenase
VNWVLPKGVQSQFSNVLDVDLHFLSGDRHDGDVLLVLFHPMPLSSYMWVPVIQRLSGQVDCVAPDLLGFGKTGQQAGGYGIKRQVEVLCQWIGDILGERSLVLVGHGVGSVVMHGVAAAFKNRIQSVAMYEGYLQPISQTSDLGLPMEQLYHVIKQSSLYETVVVEDFMMNQFLTMISEGRLSDHDIEIYRSAHLTENSRRVFLDILIQMMSYSKEGEFSSAITKGLEVYQDDKIKKVLMYSMPGLISGLLQLDQFRSSYPSVVISEVGEGSFLAPVFCAELFAQSIVKELLSQRSTMD